jgi:hypothetical protein
VPQGTTFAIPVQLHRTMSTPVPMNIIIMESSTDSNMWLHFFIAVAKVQISEQNAKSYLRIFECEYLRPKVKGKKISQTAAIQEIVLRQINFEKAMRHAQKP